jgi:hypothetical protein
MCWGGGYCSIHNSLKPRWVLETEAGQATAENQMVSVMGRAEEGTQPLEARVGQTLSVSEVDSLPLS